jgi:hypothetical protein
VMSTTSGDANPAYATTTTSNTTIERAGATMLVPNAITRADPTTSRASPRISWLPTLMPRSSWCTVRPSTPVGSRLGLPGKELFLLASSYCLLPRAIIA